MGVVTEYNGFSFDIDKESHTIPHIDRGYIAMD